MRVEAGAARVEAAGSCVFRLGSHVLRRGSRVLRRGLCVFGCGPRVLRRGCVCCGVDCEYTLKDPKKLLRDLLGHSKIDWDKEYLS